MTITTVNVLSRNITSKTKIKLDPYVLQELTRSTPIQFPIITNNLSLVIGGVFLAASLSHENATNPMIKAIELCEATPEEKENIICQYWIKVSEAFDDDSSAKSNPITESVFKEICNEKIDLGSISVKRLTDVRALWTEIMGK